MIAAITEVTTASLISLVFCFFNSFSIAPAIAFDAAKNSLSNTFSSGLSASVELVVCVFNSSSVNLFF
jgi:hypothetical protein